MNKCFNNVALCQGPTSQAAEKPLILSFWLFWKPFSRPLAGARPG
jgi:hypothetical protein